MTLRRPLVQRSRSSCDDRKKSDEHVSSWDNEGIWTETNTNISFWLATNWLVLKVTSSKVKVINLHIVVLGIELWYFINCLLEFHLQLWYKDERIRFWVQRWMSWPDQVWLRMAEAHALRTRRLVSSSFHCFRLFVCYITVCLCSFGHLFT